MLKLIVSMFIMMTATPASAFFTYMWVTEEGTGSFTDDESRIPDKYRHIVEEWNLESLFQFYRYTPADQKEPEYEQ